MNPSTERIPIVDGLRGLAILLVVLFHVYLHVHFAFQLDLFGIPLEFHTFTQSGYLGVEIFFFVSGFCLMLPYASWACGKRERPRINDYISRRFWKIVPSYYLALFTIAAFYPIDAQPGITRLNDVIIHALFLHGFFEHAFASLNGNFWSLAVEVEFYVIFPLVALLLVRRPVLATCLCVAVTLVYSNTIGTTAQDGIFLWAYQLPDYLAIFALGMLSAYIYEKWIADARLPDHTRTEMTVLAIAAFAALGYCFEQLNRVGGGPQAWEWQNAHHLEIGLILSIFTLSALASTRRFQMAFANPVLRFFSDISYNMYLWNAPIVAYISDHWGGPYGGLHGFEGWFYMVKIVAATTLAGWVLTRCYERPLMRWRGGRRASPVPAVSP